ncbi:isochorismatase family cysteine hydrolase [Streptomyces sp. NPDC055060]
MVILEPASTALVLVDLMPRIIDLPLGPRSGAEALDAACTLAARFRAAGAPVIAVRTERPHVVRQPPGSELHQRVADLADAVVVKGTIGAFHHTGLHELLHDRRVSTLVLAGIATNMGVESTARAASDHDYELVFVEDATTALTAAEHHAAITLNLPRFGQVASGTELTLEAVTPAS